MPKPFVYRNGQVVMLRVTVVNDADLGNVVVDLGGLTMSIPQVNLDRADVRPESAREKTDEERDRTAGEDRTAEEDRAAKEQAAKTKAAANKKAEEDKAAAVERQVAADRKAAEDRAAKARADAEAKKPSAAADLQSP